MKKYDWQEDKLPEIVKNCVNLTEVLNYLEIPRQGNNSVTLKGILDRNGIDYSHFTGRAREYAKPLEKSVEYYLTNETNVKPFVLKKKLLEAGLKENRCECCGITDWNGKPLVMQLHHVDGNTKNNKIENLQILCPNCHSQTENYCGAANKSEQNYCPDCGKPITKAAKYCSMCAHKHTVRNSHVIPSPKQLAYDFLELKSFLQVGKKYGISDNAVRKWCKKYQFPTHIQELNEFINDQDILNNLPGEVTQELQYEPRKVVTKYNYDEIISLVKLKYNITDISKYIGCSESTVKKAIAGVCTLRNKSSVPIYIYENDILIKITFGYAGTAKWLISEYNLKTSEDSLSSKISYIISNNESYLNLIFKQKDLPDIVEIMKDENLKEKIYKLVN